MNIKIVLELCRRPTCDVEFVFKCVKGNLEGCVEFGGMQRWIADSNAEWRKGLELAVMASDTDASRVCDED